LFSVYEDLEEKNPKILRIKEKSTGNISELKMDHNSIIIFSTETNAKYLHKIVSNIEKKTKSRWLGITFRLSRTFVEYRENEPYFIDTDERMLIATENERKKFYNHKSSENTQIGYEYPYENVRYTLSKY
jgi:hypothetical protein